jgi:hypothetical protein
MKRIGKNTAPLAGMAALIALTALLALGCANPLNPGEDEPLPGTGYVRVNIGAGFNARTLLPNPEQLYYVLTFTKGAETVTENLGGAAEATVALTTGTWSLAVLGYASPMDVGLPGAAVVNGNASFTVSAETNAEVTVALSAAQSGTGTLRYRLEYPASPAVSGGKLYLEKIGGGFAATLDISPGSYGSSVGTIPQLDSGYYQLNIYLYNGLLAIVSDLVHIYDDMETEAKLVFTSDHFAETANLAALKTAIAAAREAPAGIKISADGLDIAAGIQYVPQNALDTLNAAINAAETITAFYGSGLTQTAVDGAVTTLNAAISAFNTAKNPGSVSPGATELYADTGSGDTLISAAGTNLGDILSWLSNSSNTTDNTGYTIKLGADAALAPTTLGAYSNDPSIPLSGLSNVSLTLKGDAAERIIQLSAPGFLFTVGSGVTLVLDQNITLRGLANNNKALLTINNNGALKMKAGSKITGNASSYGQGGGVYMDSSNVTFAMEGGEISGNTASVSSPGYGGGVCVSNGTFTMTGGEISDNTTSFTSSGFGGGVYISGYGTFIMGGGKISGNRASVSSSGSGGGVYLSGNAPFVMSNGTISGNIASVASSGYGGGVYLSSSGAFTMTGGEISGNRASVSSGGSGSSGGGVYVYRGTFTMDDGEISGNTASLGGGVYVYADSNYVGTFTMKGGASVAVDNNVYLDYHTAIMFAAITVDSLSGSGTLALLDVPGSLNSLGRTIVQKASGYTGPLPVSRFAFTGPWELSDEGKLQAKAAPLGFGETRSGFLTGGSDVHFYRFTPNFSKSYSVTVTRTPSAYVPGYYEALFISAAWANGEGTSGSEGQIPISTSTFTTPSFIATDTQDIIIMLRGSDAYPGTYTVRYNEE